MTRALTTKLHKSNKYSTNYEINSVFFLSTMENDQARIVKSQSWHVSMLLPICQITALDVIVLAVNTLIPI